MYRKVIAPVVACLLLALLAWLVFQVVKPFLVAIGWATTITVVTFPVYERLRRRLGGRPEPASILMVLGVLVVLVAPTVMLTTSLSRQAAEHLPASSKSIATRDNPAAVGPGKAGVVQGPPGPRPLGRMDPGAAPGAGGPAGPRFPDEMKKVIGGVTGMLTAAPVEPRSPSCST